MAITLDQMDGWQVMAVNGMNLTSRQRRAIAALLSCCNIPDAALLAGVGERTLYRWMSDSAFRSALTHAEGEAISMAIRRLVGLQEIAIDVFKGILEKNSIATDSLKLRAAQSILDYLLKLRELRNVEERLLALENVVGISNYEKPFSY